MHVVCIVDPDSGTPLRCALLLAGPVAAVGAERSDDDISLLDLKDKGKKAKEDQELSQDPNFSPDA
jgi:hypothetical protein